MKRGRRLLLFAGILTLIYMLASRGRRSLDEARERRALPDPEALGDAGLEDPIGVDLEKLSAQKSASYRPLKEYLTAIRVKRGSDESLLFVRKRDVEALAALIGTSPEEFLENFRRMGVVVSLN